MSDAKKCHTCKHAFTTGKDRWYCEKALADKDDCGEYMIKGDAVSRQAMFNILVKYGIHESKIAEELEELPLVNPTKTGHWIYKIYGGFHEQGNWYCSHCDYQFNYGDGHAKFCPECGYEMSELPTEEKIRDKDYDWVIKR